MRSEKRNAYEEMRLKLDVYEGILERLNEKVCDNGEVMYDCTTKELDSMTWSESLGHRVTTDEGLICSMMPYDEDTEEEWKKEANQRYFLYVKAFEICRTALEKWLEK